eukprot:g13690.t1
MMVILMMGAISVNFLDAQAPMVIVMTFVVMMALSVLAAVCWGLYRFFHQKFLKLKQFRFFTCHQKNAAGSMARLLKMELEARMPGTKTFIDCDDLNDLTRLFSYVGQESCRVARNAATGRAPCGGGKAGGFPRRRGGDDECVDLGMVI